MAKEEAKPVKVEEKKKEDTEKAVKEKTGEKETKPEKKPVKSEKAEKKPKEKEAEKKEAPKAEKIFTIPLRKVFRKSRKKRAPYAVRLIKDFVIRHLKVNDVRIGSNLNEKIWERSIEKPPRRVRIGVNTKTEEGRRIAYVELLGHEYRQFKVQKAKVHQGLKEKMMARLGPKAMEKQMLEEHLGGKEEPKPEESKQEEPKPEEEKPKKESSDDKTAPEKKKMQ